MLYLDTSLLVAALTNEAETERIQHWLGQQPVDDLAVSDWVLTELSSALSIKLRTGQIGIADRAEALTTFTRLASDSFIAIPVSRSDFHTAARLADQHALSLRGGDALHLAICANHGATLCGDAGSTLGIKTILLRVYSRRSSVLHGITVTVYSIVSFGRSHSTSSILTPRPSRKLFRACSIRRKKRGSFPRR